MKNDRFYIVHQPIIDLANGDFIGDEALVRWKNSAGNLVPPDVFILTAEEKGLIKGITRIIISKSLPLDLLKLDKSFVGGIDDVQTKSVASRIIEMAHSLDLPVVAEGVETAAQADQLRQLCVKYAQG